MTSRRSLFALIVALVLITADTTYSQKEEPTTVGGYGELHYNEPDGTRKGQLDFHRFIIYLDHSFNNWITFKSETELEHTNAASGELALEQAYLEFRVSERFGIRAGIILPPIGIINLYHEPPTFNGVERPNVDKSIIPTTWREAGAGVYGRLAEEWTYQVYLMAGLDASGFSANDGIRGGRQEGVQSKVTNPSVTGRIDYLPIAGMKLGSSFFWGNSDEAAEGMGNVPVSLLSLDVQYNASGFSSRLVGAFISIGDAEKLNGRYHRQVADQLYGWYIEGAYNILPMLRKGDEQELNPFLRIEKYNTQAKVTGFPSNPLYNRTEITLGFTYKPTPNVAVKTDYQLLNNEAEINSKQFNLGIGYSF